MIESMGSHFDPGLEQIFIMSRNQLESYYANAESGECYYKCGRENVERNVQNSDFLINTGEKSEF